jgi:hypothetical protein
MANDPARSGARTRGWTFAERAELLHLGSSAHRGCLGDVFDHVAARRGISPKTVRSKYYELKRRSRRPTAARGTRWAREDELRLLMEAGRVSRERRTRVYAAWAAARNITVAAVKAKFGSPRAAVGDSSSVSWCEQGKVVA